MAWLFSTIKKQNLRVHVRLFSQVFQLVAAVDIKPSMILFAFFCHSEDSRKILRQRLCSLEVWLAQFQ